MKTYSSLDELPKIEDCILTIGSFDGFHLGHRAILNTLKTLHEKRNQEIVVLTFQQHPRRVLDNLSSVQLLTTFEERNDLLEQHFPFIHHFVAIPFTTTFAQISAENFISDVLMKYFKPSVIVVGNDHQFGKNRLGNIFLLNELSRLFQYEVVEIAPFLISQAKTSSTFIRQAIREGRIPEANLHLGYDYFLKGKVVEGKQLGRRIGFPTANIEVRSSEKLIPLNGVYAVSVSLEKNGKIISYKGMMNIGTAPTVNHTQDVKIEVHLFDFNDNIYEQQIQVHIHKRLRNEQKFSSLEALKEQLEQDKQNALRR